MPYRRRAYKRPSYGGRDKYSIQNKAFSFTIASGTSTSFLVVPATAVEGMRKIKHLTVNLTTGADAIQLFWALVYVPQGTPVGQISIGTSANVEMYEPNQFVMNCGVVDPNAGPIRFSSPISRNLNNGDAIYLVLLGTHESGTVGVWRHLSLRCHPPVIFTLHLKFIFHMKFVGPVDVRSLHNRQGR